MTNRRTTRLANALITLLALLGTSHASAQASVGGADSDFLSCFYECKPGPDIQDQPTYRQVTTLPIVNNSRFNQDVQVNFIDGNGNPIAATDVSLTSRDVDELAVCNTIEAITGAPPPRAGVIQIGNGAAALEQQPSGVYSWIKNVNGKFFRDKPEPYDGRVTGIAKSECALVAGVVNDPTQILNDRAGLRLGPPILVEDTADGGGSGQPDLLPVRDGSGFLCRIAPGGELEVEIRNQGTVATSATTTEVRFAVGSGTATEVLATPALAPGASTTTTVPIPFGCFSPGCSFEVEADRNDVEAESNEINNLDMETCLG